MVPPSPAASPRPTRRILRALTAVVVAAIAAAVPMTTRASTPSVVTLSGGKLYYNGQQFKIRGVVYAPVPIGGTEGDPTAASFDVPAISYLHANTIGMVKSGPYTDGGQVTGSYDLYDAIYPLAEQYNLKIVVSHFYSPKTSGIDWTNPTSAAIETNLYQDLVLHAMNNPSTLMYQIGNEVFEKMNSSAQETAYAQWVGQMVNWTHQTDPNHPVMYAFSASEKGMKLLKQYAPNLDIDGQNLYNFVTASDLTSILKSVQRQWPGKPIFIKESGSDSLNNKTDTENQSAQATRIQQLATSEDQDYASQPIVGSMIFEYSDGWQLDGNPSVQDFGPTWGAKSCFDGVANDEWFGLTKAVPPGQATSRQAKSAFWALRQLWSNP